MEMSPDWTFSKYNFIRHGPNFSKSVGIGQDLMVWSVQVHLSYKHFLHVFNQGSFPPIVDLQIKPI